jgi:hypothetical protein
MVSGMTPDQVLVAHIVKALGFFALAGILVRRRAHLCWSFVAYLVVVLVSNALVSFWPEPFFTPWFWTFSHGLFDALRMGIAVELTFRTFQAFPGARATSRGLLFGLLVATSFALIAIPDGSYSAQQSSTYHLVVFEWSPRVLTGIIWLMNGLAILITWYRVPVHSYHKALLLGFVPYLLIFTTLLSLIKQWGWGFLPYVEVLDPVAFMALMGFWAWIAWRPETQPDASPAVVQLLQPWRA